MTQLLIGFAATLGMLALTIVAPLLVGFLVLCIVGYIPLVGRRGRRHPQAMREGVASEYPLPLPLPRPWRSRAADSPPR